MKKTALIVVDVQKYFLQKAPDDLPGNIAQDIEKHDYGIVVFTVFRNTENSNFIRSLNWAQCDSDEDVQLPDELSTYASTDNVFTRAAYSGFQGTALNDFLHRADIEKVVLCGVDTDACVLATAFSAFDNGYIVNIKTELTFSGNGLQSEAEAILKQIILPR